MTPETRSFGRFKVTGFAAGRIKVDGGAMFGVVPRPLWSRLSPPDDDNRVPLALNCFLVRTPDVLVLVETGVGLLLDPRRLRAYGFEGDASLERHLAGLDVRPGDVDIVFNSHLHFDHCGGDVVREASGAVVPAFPNARLVVRKGEWESALRPVAADRTSYDPKRLRPLETGGRLVLLEADGEIAPGVEAVLAPGHTAFHQCLKASDRGATFFFAGDLMPTGAHVGLDATMSYDLFPVESLESRRRVCAAALREGWVLGFSHDPHRYFGRLRRGGRGYAVDEAGPPAAHAPGPALRPRRTG
jgi:glyoxylase-like metal-dependent hydrolase (beta-lactamase superfamily II)